MIPPKILWSGFRRPVVSSWPPNERSTSIRLKRHGGRHRGRVKRALPRGTHIEEIPGESKTSKPHRTAPLRPDTKSLRLVLFQLDIPQNAGALMRLAACLGVGVDIIEPCGFALSNKRMKRAGLD